MNKDLLEPVSAAVDFYALALLRDEALFSHSLELRDLDKQSTTVIVAGGFHTAGLTHRLKEKGYSYVVITPRVKGSSKEGERLYLERILGHPLTSRPAAQPKDAVTMQLVNRILDDSRKRAEAWSLAADLHDQLQTVQFSIPPIRDIFTAMDLPWLEPSIKLALINERAQILVSAITTAKNPREARVF